MVSPFEYSKEEIEDPKEEILIPATTPVRTVLPHKEEKSKHKKLFL